MEALSWEAGKTLSLSGMKRLDNEVDLFMSYGETEREDGEVQDGFTGGSRKKASCRKPLASQSATYVASRRTVFGKAVF